jgi:hypothetical protein
MGFFEKIFQNGPRKKKKEFFKIANSQKFFVDWSLG